MYKITKDHHALITTNMGKEIEVGTIINNTFTVTDDDCERLVIGDNGDKSYGIDESILYADAIPFKMIYFSKAKLITSRIYFIDNAKRYTLLNGRVQAFLRESQFGLAIALKYEQTLANQGLSDLDVFDILALDNPRLFKEWEKAIGNKDSQKINFGV